MRGDEEVLRPYSDAVHLLEREHELRALADALTSAAAGQGVGLALTGESGAGKSTVIATALRDAHGMRVLRGQCEPLSTPRPLGPFRDLGLAVLDEATPDEAQLGAQVLAELAAEPSVLVVEDLHWLDEASADLLRYVVRRVETVPLAVVLSYRDLEIGPRHPARRLLGDFAVLDGLHTLVLQPLSEDAVREAVEGTELDAARVHRVTGGNPFFVAQVAREPDRPLPTSVRDAVLARIDEVDLDDLEVLQLIACAPDRLDDRVLPLVGVDLPALRRLAETTLLGRTERGIVFRHELARLAVESTIPPGGAPGLHARLLDALEHLEPHDPAVLTHHARAAGDTVRTLAHARAAAAEALASASNTEAAAFLEIALTHLPPSAPEIERAGLLMQLCRQQYFTGRHREAIATARASIPLWERAGEPAGVAEAYAAMAVLEYQAGRRGSSGQHARKATEIADASGVPTAIARAYTDAAMLAVIGSDLPRAAECAARLLDVATAAGLEEFVVAGHIMTAGVPCVVGEPGGRADVLEWSERAREQGWDELAWRGYIIAFSADHEFGNLRGAQRLIEDTLTYVTNRDLRVARLWHLGFRALVHMTAGRWSAAQEDSREALADVEFGANIWPHVVLGLTELRSGTGDGGDHLDDAWVKARGADEPLRYFPVLCALAEAMWMSGRPDPRVTEFAVSNLGSLTSSPDTWWAGGRMAVWLRRLGIEFEQPARLGEPQQLLLDGRYAEAASWWRMAGDGFAEAMALADSADPEHRVQAVALLDRFGAVATADRLRVELRQDGLEAVPQRPRESTRANPGGLTNRQLDVARLVALGLSNSEIATRLYISPKTADHHVSAILAKLDLPNRRAVVVQADELGLA